MVVRVCCKGVTAAPRSLPANLKAKARGYLPILAEDPEQDGPGA